MEEFIEIVTPHPNDELPFRRSTAMTQSVREDMLSSEDSRQPDPTGRILDRSGLFQQSKGRWNIRREKVSRATTKLYIFDPFHSIINLSTGKVLALMSFAYLFVIMVYAAFYEAVDDSCKLGITNYVQGLYFSMETLITIGYGAQSGDVFFNDCASPLILITSQSLIGIFLDSLAIGIVFQRFARGQSRATTVIFSNKAILRRIRGHMYFMFQVCEMRKHQLIEAHVRCYAIRHDRGPDGRYSYFQSYPMRLQHPDDELGGMLLMALPSVVVHRLDAWSPLFPKSIAHIPVCSQHHDPSREYLFPEPLQRAADIEAGERDYRGIDDQDRNISPLEDAIYNCSPECDRHDVKNHRGHHDKLVDEVTKYWKQSRLEIVVLVEGIDAATSSTLQARHSYRYDEIEIDSVFENCVDHDVDGRAVIDFNRFHQTRKIEFPCTHVRGSFY